MNAIVAQVYRWTHHLIGKLQTMQFCYRKSSAKSRTAGWGNQTAERTAHWAFNASWSYSNCDVKASNAVQNDWIHHQTRRQIKSNGLNLSRCESVQTVQQPTATASYEVAINSADFYQSIKLYWFFKNWFNRASSGLTPDINHLNVQMEQWSLLASRKCFTTRWQHWLVPDWLQLDLPSELIRAERQPKGQRSSRLQLTQSNKWREPTSTASNNKQRRKNRSHWSIDC